MTAKTPGPGAYNYKLSPSKKQSLGNVLHNSSKEVVNNLVAQNDSLKQRVKALSLALEKSLAMKVKDRMEMSPLDMAIQDKGSPRQETPMSPTSFDRDRIESLHSMLRQKDARSQAADSVITELLQKN